MAGKMSQPRDSVSLMTPNSPSAKAMRRNRWIIAILGILTPYLARLPGVPEHGWWWLTSYFGDTFWAPLFFGAFNAVCWVPAIMGSLLYKQPSSAWYPAVGALASSAVMHSTVDLSADAQAALALVVLPFFTLPFTATGWIIGYYVDRAKSKTNPL